jgi:hypothetical protein
MLEGKNLHKVFLNDKSCPDTPPRWQLSGVVKELLWTDVIVGNLAQILVDAQLDLVWKFGKDDPSPQMG